MTHVFPWRWRMGTVSHRIVDTNTPPVEILKAEIRDEEISESTTYNAVELLDTPRGFFDGCHSDEAKPSGAIGLLERGRQEPNDQRKVELTR